MKKLYAFLLAAIMGMACLTAKAATLQFSLTVDVAERVVAQTMSSGFIAIPQIVELADGQNTVTANAESLFNILASSAEYEIASVTINGVEQTITDPQAFSWYVPFDFEGSEVVVTTALAGQEPQNPDDPQNPEDPQTEMCHVSFEFATDAAREYIRAVSIYNEPVPGFLDGFDVEKGTPLEVELNTSLKVDEFTVNGVAPFIMVDRALFSVEENTVIYVKLHEDVEYNFTVVVDDASRAEVGYWVTIGSGWFAQRVFTPFEIADGENALSVSEAVTTSVVIRAKGDGNAVSSIKVDGEEVEVADETTVVLADGMVIDITTSSRSRDAVCVVNCDDPSKVQILCGSTPVELVSETQTVEFFSDSESMFTISPRSYSDKIWRLSVNGVQLAPTYGDTYMVEVADGYVIDIVTKAEDVSVSFSYADDYSKGAISRITVMKEGLTSELTDFDGESFTVPVGSYVSIYTNPDMVIEEFAVIGSDLLAYPGSYEFSVAGETSVYIKAVEKVKTSVSIDVDTPEYVKAYYVEHTTNWIGMPVDKEVTIGLVAGENTVVFDEAPETIYIVAQEGARLTEVSVDGENRMNAADGDNAVVALPVVSGMTVVIRSELLTGIADILAPGACADVYDMHGAVVIRSATAAKIRSLAPGFYIVSGRKVFVK